MQPSDLITPTQAAEILRVTPASVTRYIRQGRLRGYHRLTNRWLVSRADVEALIVEVPAVELPDTRSEREESHQRALADLRARGFEV